jgi:quercetin dioxygenase-like cupin family protein
MAIHVVNEKDVEMAKSGRGYTKWLHVTKGEAGPEMMIRHWGPDTNIPVHSHPFHEMFYVLEGEIEIGGITYSAGACIYIEKGTPYGPTRAPKGGQVLRYAEARPPKS